MAFTATLTEVQTADQTLNIEVLYQDTVSGWEIRRVFNFQDGAAVTIAEIVAEVRRVGLLYKNGRTNLATLRASIGTVLTI